MTRDEALYQFLYRFQYFADIMAEYGLPIRPVSWYRTEAEQNDLFWRGATKAKAGQSAHNYGFAIDYAFEKYGYNVPKDWWAFGDYIARAVGLETGIAYADAGHVQLPSWKLWRA